MRAVFNQRKVVVFSVLLVFQLLSASGATPKTQTKKSGSPPAIGGFGGGGSPTTTKTSGKKSVSSVRDGRILVRNRAGRTVRFKSRYTIDETGKRLRYSGRKTYSIESGKGLYLTFQDRNVAIKAYGYTILPSRGGLERHFAARKEWSGRADSRLIIVFGDRHVESLEKSLRRLASQKSSVEWENCPKCNGRGLSKYLKKCRHCDGNKKTPFYPKGDFVLKGAKLTRSLDNPQKGLVVYKKGLLPGGGESTWGFIYKIDSTGVTYALVPKNQVRPKPSDRAWKVTADKLRRVKTEDGVYTVNSKSRLFDFKGKRHPFSDSGPIGEVFHQIADLKSAWESMPSPIRAKVKSGAKLTLSFLSSVANKYEFEEGYKKCEACGGDGKDGLGIKCFQCKGLKNVKYERMVPRR